MEALSSADFGIGGDGASRLTLAEVREYLRGKDGLNAA